MTRRGDGAPRFPDRRTVSLDRFVQIAINVPLLIVTRGNGTIDFVDCDLFDDSVANASCAL
jgi:hypothetical protein